MKLSLLDFLQCPECRSPYNLVAEKSDGEEVMEGRINCLCKSHPIVRGVPLMLTEKVDPKNCIRQNALARNGSNFR